MSKFRMIFAFWCLNIHTVFFSASTASGKQGHLRRNVRRSAVPHNWLQLQCVRVCESPSIPKTDQALDSYSVKWTSPCQCAYSPYRTKCTYTSVLLYEIVASLRFQMLKRVFSLLLSFAVSLPLSYARSIWKRIQSNEYKSNVRICFFIWSDSQNGTSFEYAFVASIYWLLDSRIMNAQRI